MVEHTLDGLHYRVQTVEQRMDNQEKLTNEYHKATTLRLDLIGEHLSRQDAALGEKLQTISNKLAVADGVKAEKLEQATKVQTRWFICIAVLGVLATLFAGTNTLHHILN
jgi:3-keto-L-gulonate-6-phosphate decarboxylase